MKSVNRARGHSLDGGNFQSIGQMDTTDTTDTTLSFILPNFSFRQIINHLSNVIEVNYEYSYKQHPGEVMYRAC